MLKILHQLVCFPILYDDMGGEDCCTYMYHRYTSSTADIYENSYVCLHMLIVHSHETMIDRRRHGLWFVRTRTMATGDNDSKRMPLSLSIACDALDRRPARYVKTH